LKRENYEKMKPGGKEIRTNERSMACEKSVRETSRVSASRAMALWDPEDQKLKDKKEKARSPPL
jgi:hypothetical protein